MGRSRCGWLVPAHDAVAGSGHACAVGQPPARCDRSSTHWPSSAPGRPAVAQFDSAATRRTPGYCRRPARPAAPLGSMHEQVWNEPHPVAYRHSAQGRPTSAGACADSAPTPRPQDACGRQLQALRATMQRIAAALATRSVVLVDVAPVGIELFLQYQQSCRLGQGLVFAPQLLLQLPDTLLVRFGLCLLRLL